TFLKELSRRFMKSGRQKLTIMLVPHTEKRILNLQLSFFGLGGIIIAFGVVLSVSVLATSRFGNISRMLSGKVADLSSTQADLDAVRDETTTLIKAARNFEAALSSTLSQIGIQPSSSSSGNRDGDLSAFFDVEEAGRGSLREVGEIRKVTHYLERTVRAVQELGGMVASKSEILSEIPNLWPIKGGIGHISMHYGQNENPFFGSWYLHKGLDISTFRTGDAIVATADGQVAHIGYDPSYGNNIILEHKHGFFTRYAHLQSFRIQKGQRVQQGQVIGYIGNTGLTTGPHLHYEVHLGTETVDPLRFLNIRPSPR
ncbi:MAG TPA: M23 family metallopeptidase, partial [Magnetospirillaceae bacterium]|nr:M23 family metallopeptidase [Magnetospirillaceae bacterium]